MAAITRLTNVLVADHLRTPLTEALTQLFGALALLGGMIWLVPPAYLFLTWLTAGARTFATLPDAAVQLPPFPLWLLLSYYAIVMGRWLWSVDSIRLRASQEMSGQDIADARSLC